MTEPFVVAGDLWLYRQEGGFADDAWVLKAYEPNFAEQLLNVVSNEHRGFGGLDDMVAEHFGIERQRPIGNRHIGRVKITIEKLDAEVL